MDRHEHQRKKLLRLIADGSIWTAQDLRGEGISSTVISQQLAANLIERVSRGVYRAVNAPVADRQSLAEAAARVPNGIVCLYSAAEYHGLCTKNPDRIYLGLRVGRHPPKIEHPPIRPVFWRNEKAFHTGIQETDIAGVRVRITDEARTVVDLYRFRERGVDPEHAMEALNTFIDRGGSTSKLRSYAKALGGYKTISEHLAMKLHMGVTP